MKRVLQYLIPPILALAVLAGGAFYWLERICLPEYAAKFSLHGAPVHMQEPPSIRFFPLRLELGPFSWENNPGGIHLAFSASGAALIPVTGAIIAGDEEIWQIILDSPHIVVRQMSGEGQTAPGAPAERQAAVRSPLHLIRSVFVNNGVFAVSLPGLDLHGNGWNLSLWNLRPRQEMQIRCSGNLFLQQTSLPPLSGHLALTAPLRYYAPNLSFQGANVYFTVSDGLWALLNPLEITGNGAINNETGALRLTSTALKSPLARGEISGIIRGASFQGNARLAFGPASQKDPVTLDGDMCLDSAGLALANGTIAKGALNAAGSGNINFVDRGELARLDLLWADGEVKAGLKWDGKSFTLDAAGKNIQLGEALDQLGIHGFNGCPAKFAAALNFSGANALAMRRSVRGKGSMSCQGLALEPFGELALLLPLLGKDLQFPDMIEDISASFTARDGIVTFAPVSAQGKGISCQSRAELNLADSTVKGSAAAKLLGISIPISFSGPLDNVDFRIGK